MLVAVHRISYGNLVKRYVTNMYGNAFDALHREASRDSMCDLHIMLVSLHLG